MAIFQMTLIKKIGMAYFHIRVGEMESEGVFAMVLIYCK